jgi:hypothetical protein
MRTCGDVVGGTGVHAPFSVSGHFQPTGRDRCGHRASCRPCHSELLLGCGFQPTVPESSWLDNQTHLQGGVFSWEKLTFVFNGYVDPPTRHQALQRGATEPRPSFVPINLPAPPLPRKTFELATRIARSVMGVEMGDDDVTTRAEDMVLVQFSETPHTAWLIGGASSHEGDFTDCVPCRNHRCGRWSTSPHISTTPAATSTTLRWPRTDASPAHIR